MENEFVDAFEQAMSREITRLGEELLNESKMFLNVCGRRHPQAKEDYEKCRRQRDSFMKEQMVDISQRVKLLQKKTITCCQVLGDTGLPHCQEMFKSRLDGCYKRAFLNYKQFNQ